MLDNDSIIIGLLVGFGLGVFPIAIFFYHIERGKGKWENKKYIWTRFNKRLGKIA